VTNSLSEFTRCKLHIRSRYFAYRDGLILSGQKQMANTLAWILFALGIGHIVYALVVHKKSIADAVAAGYVGQFGKTPARHLAFWCFMFGPLLMLAGHTALHAMTTHDAGLYRLLAIYVLVVASLGAAAMPKSPFSLALVVAVLMVVVGL
jgi:uncharacterized membrane protein YhaH (DUF805 family)